MEETVAEPSNTLLYCSLLGFLVISWLVWKFVLAAPPPAARAGSGRTTTTSSRASSGANGAGAVASARTRRAAGASSGGGASSAGKDDDDDGFSFGQPRHPSHLVAPDGWTHSKTDLSGCLLQGVVPFRSTFAAGYEARLAQKGAKDDNDKDLIVVNRRERARVFARMFSSQKSARPPNRGMNVVVTIRHADVPCPKLQKALYLLGTYYNLFVLIDGSDATDVGDNDEERRGFIKKLRSSLLNEGESGSGSNEYQLNAEIIPRHRIAFSSTSKGRVAFVRQLHGTELVVDFEEDVTKELERFGFRSLLYPKCDSGTSALGQFLVP